MQKISLRTMSQDEFEIYRRSMRERLINDAMKSVGATRAQAEKIMDMDLNEIAPDGLASKNNGWLAIVYEEAQVIGGIWYDLRGTSANLHASLNDIFIEEKYRRRGYAKQAITKFEQMTKAQGSGVTAVHLMGDMNEAALRLFRSTGHFVTTIKLEKVL